MRSKVFVNLVVGLVVFGGALHAVGAEQAEEKAAKLRLKPYGFVKGDMYYVGGGPNSDGALSWNKQAITCVSLAARNGGEGVSFTAQHSRFGLAGDVTMGDVVVGGKVELDFFVVDADANARPRMRQAFGWVKPLKGLDVRIGQQWDLFSPLNPTTNNTNANLWYNGNYGFRRPQFQLRYTAPLETVKPGIQVCIGEATKEATGTGTLGADNISWQPMYQARVNVGLPLNMDVGVSGTYATYGKHGAVETWGLSLDVNAPLNKYIKLKGEYAYGRNLNNANIFTLGGSGSKDEVVAVTGAWLNAISKPLDFMQVVLGYSTELVLDRPNTDNPAGMKATELAKRNNTVYADVGFIIGKYFSFTIEGQRIFTFYDNDVAAVNVLDVAGKVTF